MRKVLLISNIPAAYRKDIYVSLLKSNNMSFLFFNDKASSHKKIIFSNSNEIKSNTISNTSSSFFSISKNLLLNLHRFDIVINVGFNLPSLICILLKPFYKYKLLNWWGGTIDSEKDILTYKKIFRKLNWMFYDGSICYSKLSFEYLKTLNKNKQFAIVGNNTYKIKKRSIKKKIFHFINVAFHDKRKNTIIILKAFKLVKEILGDKISMIIIGNGPEKKSLIKYSNENNLEIIFKKNLNPDLVQSYLSCSKFFVHNATVDQWPQTYNEAMNNRVIPIVSESSGISDFYTTKNKSIITYNSDDFIGLSKIMLSLYKDKKLCNDLLNDIECNLLKYNCVSADIKINRLFNTI